MSKQDSSAPPAPAAAPARTFRTRSGTVRAQRASERRELELPVEIAVGEGPAKAAIAKNLSIGGAFIQTDDPAPFGAAITVVIRLPGLGTATIPSTVRWCKESGMGVQFGAMGARETHGLTELLRVGAD